jgi:hypothetical protein
MLRTGHVCLLRTSLTDFACEGNKLNVPEFGVCWNQSQTLPPGNARSTRAFLSLTEARTYFGISRRIQALHPPESTRIPYLMVMRYEEAFRCAPLMRGESEQDSK